MGWICISETCNGHIVNGNWDGTGGAYYSIATDMQQLFDAATKWFFSIGSWIFVIALLFFFITLVMTFLWAINKRIQVMGRK